MKFKTPLIQSDREDRHDDLESHFPDWRELVAILIERAWVGLSVAAVVFLFFLIQVYREVPFYRSTAVLLVEAQIPRLLNYQEVVSFNSRNLEYFNTIIKTLYTRQIMEQAVLESGLADRAGFLEAYTGVEAKAAAALNYVKIEPVEKSRLINITVEYSDPQAASDLANAVAHSYIQQDLDDRMNASMQAVEWLRLRSIEYREKMEAGLLALQQYRENTESVSLEEDQNIVTAKLKALNVALIAAQTERIDAQAQWQAAHDQIERNVPLIRIAAHLNNAAVNEVLRQLQEQEQVVTQLEQRYKPGYPDLQQALELKQQLQLKFKETCGNAVDALMTRLEMLQTREASLQKALKEQEQQAFDLDRKLVRYNDLKRNVEGDQEIYQSVISRMKEASISGSLPMESIRLVEKAQPAAAPFRPQPGRAILRGFFFGMVFGLGTIFVLYYTDHRFRRNEEVERALHIPVLATLPLIEGQNVHERGLIAHRNQTGDVAESFRTLRATMLMNPDIRKSKVFMVTSSQAGEGKSLVSTNLAVTFAQDGRKTLLIGADMRRPALTQIFAADKADSGLCDVLKGACKWRDVLLKHSVPNLDVLPSGRTPEHPSELLGNAQFGRLIEEARTTYERIIIDAPPVLGVSDTLVLLAHTDGVLFVVRYGVTHSLSASHAIKKIEESGTPALGALMNGVNLSSLSNYYYYRRSGEYSDTKYLADSSPPAV